jgi:hypothetical protein
MDLFFTKNVKVCVYHLHLLFEICGYILNMVSCFIFDIYMFGFVKLDDVGWRSKYLKIHELNQRLKELENFAGIPIALFSKSIFFTLDSSNANVKDLNNFIGEKWQVQFELLVIPIKCMLPFKIINNLTINF